MISLSQVKPWPCKPIVVHGDETRRSWIDPRRIARVKAYDATGVALMTAGQRTRAATVLFAALPVVALVHVIALASGQEWLSLLTKPFIMLVLALALLWSIRRLTAAAITALVAILCSWLGDVALMVPGELAFGVGILLFMLAQAGYVLLFVRHLRTRNRPPVWALVYLVWLVAGIALLSQQDMGALYPAVVLYAVVIGAMAASSTMTTPTIALGGALFLVSDSLIALDRFVPAVSIWAADEIIMASYAAGQGLIVWGVAAALRRRERAVVPA
jgi:uncharacterized membrane protein YhhN